MKTSVLRKIEKVSTFNVELSNSQKLQVVKASAQLEQMRLNKALKLYCIEAKKFLSAENFALITFSKVCAVINADAELSATEFFSIVDIERVVKAIFKAENVKLREFTKAEKLAAKLARQAAKAAKA
jgi:hypothetical protein